MTLTNRVIQPAFLRHLQSLIPKPKAAIHNPRVNHPWYIATLVALSGCNRPEMIPAVFEHVLSDIPEHADKLVVARKFRESLFKSGLTTGYSRAINSLIALNEVMPEELKDTKLVRNQSRSLKEYESVGKSLFTAIYGDTAGRVQGTLDEIYPDMGYFSNTIGYGFTYGCTEIISPLETSYMLIAALISVDTPLQARWHLDGALRLGASAAEVQGVRKIAIEVSKKINPEFSEERVPEVDVDLERHI